MKGSAGPLEITVSSLGARIEGTVTCLGGGSAGRTKEKAALPLQVHYDGSVRTHFDLRGLPPGKYKLFSWDGVEQGEWEDADFLKDSEEKGATVDLKGSDTKAIELKLIQMKNTARTSE